MTERILRKKDFYGGILLACLGLVALATALDYPMGSARRMGPGYFPMVLAVLLILLGGAIAFVAWFYAEADVEPIPVRPFLCVVLAVLLFGFLLEKAGLVLSAVVVVLVSCLGGARVHLVESLILAAFLSVGIVVLFVYALNIPFPIWPA